jgi:hypothetical protein
MWRLGSRSGCEHFHWLHWACARYQSIMVETMRNETFWCKAPWRAYLCGRYYSGISITADRLIDWLVEWLTDIDWLSGLLTDLVTDWLIYWLIDELIDLLTDWLNDWPTGWLIDCFTDLFTDWPTDWLTPRPRVPVQQVMYSHDYVSLPPTCTASRHRRPYLTINFFIRYVLHAPPM